MTVSRLQLVTPPSGSILTLEEIKTQLGIYSSDYDDELEMNRIIAESFFDGPKGYLERALLPQTWDYITDGFPCGNIYLPLPPLISITSVNYTDLGGAATLLASDLYDVSGISGLGALRYIDNAWPQTQYASYVTIRFVAGYEDADSIPPIIKKAMVLKIAQMRGLSKSDALLKQDQVIGVSSQTWEATGVAFDAYEKAITALVSAYMDMNA